MKSDSISIKNLPRYPRLFNLSTARKYVEIMAIVKILYEKKTALANYIAFLITNQKKKINKGLAWVFKLNTDGCSRGNSGRAGGGGVLRDGVGNFLLAFSSFFGSVTSIQVEACTVLFGVRLCILVVMLTCILKLTL